MIDREGHVAWLCGLLEPEILFGTIICWHTLWLEA